MAGIAAWICWFSWLGAACADADPAPAKSPYENLRTLARVLAHVEASYVEPPDQDALLLGAIRGMVGALDPHSEYLDPAQYRMLTSDTEGRFAGVGVEIHVRDGWLVVAGVFPGGPAARAGVRVGDRVLRIDGVGARDLPIEQAIQRVRGEPGTIVRLALRREDTAPAVEVDLRRAIIDYPAVETMLLPGKIVWLRLHAFQQTTHAEVRAALDACVAEAGGEDALGGVLLDLRDNPGGLVDQAVAVSDEFLRDGVIVSTRGRDGRLLSQATAHRLGTRPAWPMAILINGYSASAAEIVAAALRDHERATLIGERTFGKGSVQSIVELADGGALKLTIARYYTPSGRSLQATGIEPDIWVAQPLVRTAPAPAGLSEADLAGHLDSVGSQDSGGPDRNGPSEPLAGASERPFSDDPQGSVGYQTLRALIAERARAAGH